MPCSASGAVARLRLWFRDYERVQIGAVILIYVQIGCALVGSLGALYNGILLIHLMLSLFALIAIESNSQNLGRTYAVLLACGIVLDIMWLILFSQEIWNMSAEKYGHLFVFSLRLTLWMQIIGFSMRSLSSLLWIQMYRLGVLQMGNAAAYVEPDFDSRNVFLNPQTNEIARQSSNPNVISEGNIYDPAYYSSLFEDAQGKVYMNAVNFPEDRQLISHSSGSASTLEPSEFTS